MRFSKGFFLGIFHGFFGIFHGFFGIFHGFLKGFFKGIFFKGFYQGIFSVSVGILNRPLDFWPR